MSRRLSIEELEERARGFRRRLGVEFIRYLDPMTIITKLKVRIPGLNYLRVPPHQMQGIYAQWDSETKILRIRCDVYEKMQSHDPRSRFTIFHEVQHILYEHQGVRNRNINSAMENLIGWDSRRVEIEANRATSVFMAPHYLIAATASIVDIMRDFGLSYSAASIRKEEVDRFNRISKGNLRELPEHVKDFLRDARAKGHNIQTKLE